MLIYLIFSVWFKADTNNINIKEDEMNKIREIEQLNYYNLYLIINLFLEKKILFIVAELDILLLIILYRFEIYDHEL